MADSVGPQQEGTAFQDPNFIDVRSKVEGLEMELNGLSEELGKNIKQFELVTVSKKQVLDTLHRNLDDTERICSQQLSKFNDTVQRDIEHNVAAAGRVQEDINHLADQQSKLRVKLTNVEKRIGDLENQIGTTPYY